MDELNASEGSIQHPHVHAVEKYRIFQTDLQPCHLFMPNN